MEKSLILIRISGSISRRKHGIKLHSHKSSVHHSIFGRTGMNIDTCKIYYSFRSIEILKLDLTFCVTVQGIGVIGVKFLHIKMSRPHTDLFIRRKRDRYLSMRDRITVQVFNHGHDLCDTGFVIGTQNGGSVGCDKSPAFQGRKMREHFRGKNPSAFSQWEILTIVDRGQYRCYFMITEI